MHVWSPLGNLPCVTHDNIQHASRVEAEPIQMHLRNRSGAMHKRWLFRHTRMHVHTSKPTKHCRPSHNAPKIMNAFTCDPDLQRATLRATGNDLTLLNIRTSPVNGKWNNGETLFFVLFTKNWLHVTQNYRLIPPNTMSRTTDVDKLQTRKLF